LQALKINFAPRGFPKIAFFLSFFILFFLFLKANIFSISSFNIYLVGDWVPFFACFSVTLVLLFFII
jgi:hypothetical protein